MRAQHSSGKREKPTAAGVVAFILLVATVILFVADILVDSVLAHTILTIAWILTLAYVYPCIAQLESRESKHSREDDWSLGDFRRLLS